MILADIASGEVDTADFFFLVATVLAVVAALLAIPISTYRRTTTADHPDHGTVVGGRFGWHPVIGWLAVAAVALAFLLL